MSAESRAITAEQFKIAIQDLPIENIYSKANEIRNSISHLERSNKQLQEYSDSIKSDTSLPDETRQEGDKDCLEAVEENSIVIARQQERIDLLKQEVERRGGRWHESQDTNGKVNGEADAPVESRSGGRLTDEQLRQQMLDRLGDDDQDDDSGMHL
ncbi:hypothetical protein PV10_04870 [Exophiala mesophila]|uniref:Uncharacterized protein n=1 Tax=Exophiala mesophila TaxID=212818 RepID=A0A0D1WWB9_EXOME|nr:uncharacterized protein PV10_04870 [Exophiala mesophila]KIV93675.1 hypothetical protein PV10_04870 [Exophiala mesophila]